MAHQECACVQTPLSVVTTTTIKGRRVATINGVPVAMRNLELPEIVELEGFFNERGVLSEEGVDGLTDEVRTSLYDKMGGIDFASHFLEEVKLGECQPEFPYRQRIDCRMKCPTTGNAQVVTILNPMEREDLSVHWWDSSW